MKPVMKSLSLAVIAGLALPAAVANAAEFELAGNDGSGYLSFSNVKATVEQSAADAWNFPYYLEDGIYRSIASVPLSEDSVYAEEALYSVMGKDITAADFATLSAGSISYDDGVLTGVGVETISAADLAITVNGSDFSPFSSGYNTGAGIGDFPFNYIITASNISGNGLTFTDGMLTSVDLDSDINVEVQLGDLPMFLGSTYDGSLSITGATYAFDLDVTQDTTSPLGDMTDTRMVFNRTGTISAVSAVPEPSVYAMFAGGLLVAGAFARRNRRS